MYNAKMQYLLFATLGLISGTVCVLAGLVLPEYPWLMDHYPGIILGIFLWLAGHYVARLPAAGKWPGMLVPIVAGVLGWRLSIEVGYELGGAVRYVSAGALGAFTIALGLLAAWRIRAGLVPFVVIVTAAGALGGAVFQGLESMLAISDHDRLWAWLLFGEWQTLLLAGVAVALHRSRR
jgi:hypothetical protein